MTKLTYYYDKFKWGGGENITTASSGNENNIISSPTIGGGNFSDTSASHKYHNSKHKDMTGGDEIVTPPKEGRKELIALESDRFRRYLAKLFYDNNNRGIAKTENINSAVQILQANVEYDGQTIPLSLIVAWKEDTICYDLTDEKWRYVKITKDGCEIRDDDALILFARHNQVTQVLPDRNYEPDILDKFIGLTNVKDDKDRLLLKVYIISLFVPDIAHAMLIIHGEQGAAKSLLQRMIKELVDPSRPILLTIYASRDEFVQQLSHNYVAYYDNVKYRRGKQG